MKIDYKKILKINKNTVNKYINKPLFNNNYLFHYYILLNHIQGLKLVKFPVYYTNSDGLNAFHLAAKMDNYEILVYLIKTYKDYIYNKDTHNHTFVYYLSENTIIKIINKFPELDWSYLIPNKLLNYFFLNFSFNNINKLINLLKINNVNKYLYNIIYNNNVSTQNKIKIFDKFDNKELNIKNSFDGSGLLLDSLIVNDKVLFDYFIKHDIDFDYYTIIKTDNSFRLAIRNDIISNKKYYSEILLKKYISKKHNFDYELNKYGDNIIHSILYVRINRLTQIDLLDYNKLDYTIDTDILKYCNNNNNNNFSSLLWDKHNNNLSSLLWNQPNNDKITPIELIINLDFDKYKSFVNTKITIANKNKIINNNIDDNWLKFINGLEIFTEENDIKINELPYVNYTLFQSKFKDLALFMLYLSDKYSNLFVPIIDSHLLTDFGANGNILFTDNIITFKQIFPWYISYLNKNEYYIHPYLNNIIKGIIKENKKKYAIVFLSRNYETTLHANILFYDFMKMTVERFEPYGDIELTDIDDILEEELTWDINLRYIRPKDYLKKVGFQTLSNENNILNQKPGDFGGFCLAWCIWYIETRINNINISPEKLVNKLISKLNNMNIKFSEYIRNYSNKINDNRIQYLLDIGIDYKITSNIQFDNNTENKLGNFIINTFDI